MTTIAVIQPYFFPYAGYYRLFSASDIVVMLDCVQFPRRGWVHRNRFIRSNGEPDWLTLALQKADRDVRIADLRFRDDARAQLQADLQRFPVLEKAARAKHPLMQAALAIEPPMASPYLIGLTERITTELGISRQMISSSTLAIDPALHGEQRILAIVKAVGGSRYVNPSGGHELYGHSAFNEAGIELRFLTPYGGSFDSILSRLVLEAPADVAREIVTETKLET